MRSLLMEAALEGGLDRAHSDCPRLESDVSGSWTSGKRVSVLGDSWYAGSMDILLEPQEDSPPIIGPSMIGESPARDGDRECPGLDGRDNGEGPGAWPFLINLDGLVCIAGKLDRLP
jgi:hypothetical protein